MTKTGWWFRLPGKPWEDIQSSCTWSPGANPETVGTVVAGGLCRDGRTNGSERVCFELATGEDAENLESKGRFVFSVRLTIRRIRR